MFQTIDAFDVIDVIKRFIALNEGDEATEDIILAIGANLLGVSTDALYEAVKENNNV